MLGKNIRYLRERDKLTQLQLANLLHRSYAAVSYWESGRTIPGQTVINDMARIFNVTIDDLMFKDLSDKRTQTSSISLRIKVFGTVPAGIPTEAIQDIEGFEDIPKEWTTGGREYFGLKVKGDSMYPKYENGDTIIVRKQCNFENGQDCVCYVNGDDATLKRVYKQEQGVLLQPLNPEYKPKTYRFDDPEHPVTIAGVVVEIRRKV